MLVERQAAASTQGEEEDSRTSNSSTTIAVMPLVLATLGLLDILVVVAMLVSKVGNKQTFLLMEMLVTLELVRDVVLLLLV